MIKTETNELTKHTLNLVLFNAYRIAKRASIGWALLDDANNLLIYSSVMAGTSPTKLSNTVKEYAATLNHLILSVEPGTSYCDPQELTRHIESSNCLKITIAYQMPQELRDTHWLKWVKDWEGNVDYAGYSGFAENLTAGIRSVLRVRRPWVSAVCASTMENQTLPLYNLQHEFGFNVYLDNLAKQNSAIIFNQTQKKIIEQLPAINWAGQAIDFYTAEESTHIDTILKECARKQYYSVLILCDPNKLSDYAEQNMVDEIYHHIAITNAEPGKMANTHEFLKLDNWTIISSDVVGNSIRMNIKRNDNIPQLDESLRNRLN
ncbi:MAG: hypothetical protein V4732_22340 [Pseudomonadota bacterium]